MEYVTYLTGWPSMIAILRTVPEFLLCPKVTVSRDFSCMRKCILEYVHDPRAIDSIGSPVWGGGRHRLAAPNPNVSVNSTPYSIRTESIIQRMLDEEKKHGCIILCYIPINLHYFVQKSLHIAKASHTITSWMFMHLTNMKQHLFSSEYHLA
jgi:hypothetical protein